MDVPRPAALHRAVQFAFLLLMTWVGVRFLMFALWAMGIRGAYVPKPPSVEAFLPISAMLALKRFVFSGAWDPVHPAGLSILVMALVTSLILRKGFCGYLCPIGALSFWLFRLGRKLGIACAIPQRLAWLLTIPKYLLLAFFLNITLFAFDIDGTEAFLFSRYNMVADTKMLLFFARPDALLLGALFFLAAGSLIIPSLWCRSFCPYGALLGLISIFSPVAVTRNATACSHCRRCASACPQGIAVDKKIRVASAECTGCQECVSACPVKGCLGMSAGFAKSRALPGWALPAGIVIAVGIMFAAASLSGHWESGIPREMIRQMHIGIDALRHY
jgi:polyferredoxin